MSKNKYKGKIGYVFDKDLGIKNSDRGHYVYIRDDDGSKLKVNIITSLEDKKHNLNSNRIRKVRNGLLYPIPIKDCNFVRWSAIDLSTKHINKRDVRKINNKNIKSRHKFFVGKFSK